jgi:ABC-2 type transport system permease protein
MNSVWPIAKKELRSAFNSPIAYIAMIFFLLFNTFWLFFVQRFFIANVASIRSLFQVMPWVFIILVPAITMRMWAEERKLGTVELLETLPFTEWKMVMGKFLGAFLLLCLMLVFTLPIPLLAGMFGRFDAGQIVTEYLGVLLMGAACVAIGSYISSLTKNQISAFIFTVLILIALNAIGLVFAFIKAPTFIMDALRWIALYTHFDSFEKGVLDTRDLLYYVIVGTLFLFLTVKTLVFRKWR